MITNWGIVYFQCGSDSRLVFAVLFCVLRHWFVIFFWERTTQGFTVAVWLQIFTDAMLILMRFLLLLFSFIFCNLWFLLDFCGMWSLINRWISKMHVGRFIFLLLVGTFCVVWWIVFSRHLILVGLFLGYSKVILLFLEFYWNVYCKWIYSCRDA